MITITLGVKRQLIAAYIGSLATFIGGTFMGWPAPTLKKLREEDSPIQMTLEEEAWVVNALYLATIISPFPSGALMNRIGRKMSMLVLCVVSTMSWVLIYLSTSAMMLMVARLLAGIWMGGGQTIIPIYVAEVSEPKVRGILGTLFMINIFLGTNFTFIVGPYVSFRVMAILCGLLPVLYFTSFCLCPESPYFYVMRGRHQAASEALYWLRGDVPIDNELSTIRTSIEKESQDTGFFGKTLILVSVAANRKAFIIVQIMNFFQRMCGITCIMSFSSVVLPQQVGPLTTDHCTIIMGVVWVVACFICAGLIDKAGRLPLLYVSSVGIMVSMAWTGVWYYLDSDTTLDVSAFNWLPLAGFLVYGFAFSVGLGPVAAIYQGEMFPINLKGQASALTAINTAFTSALSTIIFAFFIKNVGIYVNFFIFSAVGLINLVFTHFFVIETKGKSLQMIQAELSGEKTTIPISKGG